MSIRIKYIDAAKSVAMILVILGHTNGMNSFPQLGNAIYSFHMPVFFIISGFFIKSMSFMDALKKYSKAYLWPYLFLCLIAILIDFAFTNNCFEKVNQLLFNGIIRSFYANPYIREDVVGGGLPGIGMSWFLIALFWACMIFSVLMKYLKESEANVIMILLAAIGVITAKKIQLPFELQSGMVASMYVMIGYYIKKMDTLDKIENFDFYIKIFIIIIFVFLCNSKMCRVSLNISFLGGSIIGFVCSVLGSFIILYICKVINLPESIFGKNTLFVYGGHFIANYILLRSNISMFTDFDPILKLLMCFVVDFFFAILFGYILKLSNLYKL